MSWLSTLKMLPRSSTVTTESGHLSLKRSGGHVRPLEIQHSCYTIEVQVYHEIQHHHHSLHSSSFFKGVDAEPFDFIALVPILVLLDPASSAPPKLSQKSFLSASGPFGSSPNESQNSRFSDGTLEYLVLSSPSTKRLKASDAVCVAAVANVPAVCPTCAAANRACAPRSDSASCEGR